MRTCTSMRCKGVSTFAGGLLLAHPELRDTQFQRSVVLLAAHQPTDGAFGVVLNRPTGKVLSQVNTKFTYSPLARVPVYWGGPVHSDQRILTAWQWSEELGFLRLHFGITLDQAEALLHADADIDVRCFQGAAGWRNGQLEAELTGGDTWVPMPLFGELMEIPFEGEGLWRHLLGQINPRMLLTVMSPDAPQEN